MDETNYSVLFEAALFFIKNYVQNVFSVSQLFFL